jgi:hypothetical protein
MHIRLQISLVGSQSSSARLLSPKTNYVQGQWKRATFAAAVTACNGLGGIAGSFIVRLLEF